jgi:pyruvate formate lyase activating enzyme
MNTSGGRHPARWWHPRNDGTIQCDLCPRECRLHEGQHGACVIRERSGEALFLNAYGRSSGFCIDPIEKKPLNHFFPGSSVLSFGTAGCNLACKFCQNWDISKARHTARLATEASPEAIAQAALAHGARSVAFTYNDPVIFAEYAMDVAEACHASDICTVAVTAGYIQPEPRSAFFACMDAANVDLKGFSDSFYTHLCGGHLAPVLDTLVWLRHQSSTWLEVTTLLIPDANDSTAEIEALCQWFLHELGPEVPLHFTAFHPSYKLLDRPATPLATLLRARQIALAEGLLYVYLGNVQSPEGSCTDCPVCHSGLIRRDGYAILSYQLTSGACCPNCGAHIAGHFAAPQTTFGNRRMPVQPGRDH